jgi:hypothetical protein
MEKHELYKLDKPKIDKVVPGTESIIQQAVRQLTDKVKVARELQITAALRRAGYEFETTEELYSFAKERCHVEDVNGKQCLYVDKVIYVCEWNNTPRVEYFGDKITVTI